MERKQHTIPNCRIIAGMDIKALSKLFELIRYERRTTPAVRSGYYFKNSNFAGMKEENDVKHFIRHQYRLNWILIAWLWVITLFLVIMH